MARQNVTIKGERIVIRNLNKASNALQGSAAVAAVVSGALIIANEAKTRAPVRTGTLRRSIHVGGHTDRTPDFLGTGTRSLPAPRRTFKGVRAYVGTNVVYAPFQEFGTSRMAAQPYMRPAMDTKRLEVKKEMATVLNKQLNRTLP